MDIAKDRITVAFYPLIRPFPTTDAWAKRERKFMCSATMGSYMRYDIILI